VLQGLLTKKDVWYVLNGAEETRQTSGLPAGMGVESGLTREDGGGEAQGLLRGVNSSDEAVSPGIERESML
jgi:chloride channel 3/4/5